MWRAPQVPSSPTGSCSVARSASAPHAADMAKGGGDAAQGGGGGAAAPARGESGGERRARRRGGSGGGGGGGSAGVSLSGSLFAVAWGDMAESLSTSLPLDLNALEQAHGRATARRHPPRGPRANSASPPPPPPPSRRRCSAWTARTAASAGCSARGSATSESVRSYLGYTSAIPRRRYLIAAVISARLRCLARSCGPVGGVRGVWPRARGLVRRQVPAQADAARPDEGPLPRGRRSSSCARRLLIRRSSE